MPGEKRCHVVMVQAKDVNDETLDAGDELPVVGIPLLEGNMEVVDVGVMCKDTQLGLVIGFVVVGVGAGG